MWSKRRIGKAELGRWPQIYQTSKSVIVEGEHLTPQRSRLLYWCACIALVLIVGWWILFVLDAINQRRNVFDSVIALLPWAVRRWPYEQDPALRDLARYGLAVATVALTAWSPIWMWDILVRVVPWPLGMLTRVTIKPDAITWWRWGQRLRCDRALPHDFVVEPHTRARNAKTTYYAQATQVVIRCGVGKAQRLVVADIARDPNGDRANLFRAGLEFGDHVMETMRTEQPGPVAMRGRQTIGEG